MIVAVAGCVAQAEGEEIFKRSNVVDIIVGPESYQTLPDLVGKVIREKKKQINLDFVPNDKFDEIRRLTESDILFEENFSSVELVETRKISDLNLVSTALNQRLNQKVAKASEFVTIQEGCDKFCTFCVVPYTRGAEYSREVSKILDDAKRLADQGVSEIYFLGQNVNAYHGLDQNGNAASLAKLIEEVAKIDAVKRIRYTTSHPRDMSDDLLAAHRDIEKLMPFLHLPIQSGSNSVLKGMNRKHTRQDYFKIIEKLRKARPDIGLSSDFIVGFPGETDKDFEDTMDLVRKIGFTQCYSFKYSQRPGTPAADAKVQVEENVKDVRLAELQKLLTEQQIEFNKKAEGQIMPVLFEREAPKSKKSKVGEKIQLWGKSPYLQSVIVDVDSEIEAAKYFGKIADVKILKARPSSLVGELK
ncbi:MAG: tRNA (N6-isopentenyl adenosine(37)-C2)-methylthiotransferase MiaB [Rickettsiales bacterium]|nr:tRNA (N6-isopentenyl adenosine(37)-C2)-methylthiotransferase MiaB [Rickettsiales bacterium]